MNHQDEVVSGIVLMRKYGNTLKTLKGVEEKVEQLNTTGMLPKGYKIIPYYDRTGLVYTTLHTVFENLSLGMVLVFLVLTVFSGQSAYRDHRSDKYSTGYVRRLYSASSDRYTSKPIVTRGSRLWHHNRFDHHRGRKHLSPPDRQ